MSTGLTARTEAGVRWLVLDRPEVGNSVTRAMQRDLIDNLAAASSDPEIRAVVFAASGDKHFCTGPNLRDPNMRPSQDRIAGDAARILRTGSQAVVTALLDCDKPVICALNGVAAGVGASMVLACDLIIAVEGARLIELFVRRGLAPDGGAAYLLTRKVPFNVAKRLILFGEELSATEAHRIGLVHEVVADADALDVRGQALAEAICANGPNAVAESKDLIFAVDRPWSWDVHKDTARRIARVRASAEGKEGVSAFLEKRPRDFSRFPKFP